MFTARAATNRVVIAETAASASAIIFTPSGQRTSAVLTSRLSTIRLRARNANAGR
jgi:hypothetical protein